MGFKKYRPRRAYSHFWRKNSSPRSCSFSEGTAAARRELATSCCLYAGCFRVHKVSPPQVGYLSLRTMVGPVSDPAKIGHDPKMWTFKLHGKNNKNRKLQYASLETSWQWLYMHRHVVCKKSPRYLGGAPRTTSVASGCAVFWWWQKNRVLRFLLVLRA